MCTIYARIVLPPISIPDIEQNLIVRHEHFLDIVLDIEPLIDADSFVRMFPVMNKSKLIQSTIEESLC